MGIKVLAFDLGASSGRAVLGDFDGERLSLAEFHRFSNDPVMLGGTFYWDFLRLMYNIKTGVGKAAHMDRGIASLGIDTWGVDFGLLDGDGRLLENPVHYRDERTAGMPQAVFRIIPQSELYMKTGTQISNINTLFQLYAVAQKRPALMERARQMLMMPDLINYFLTGARVTEYSIASTSQLLDPFSRRWAMEIPSRLGIPSRLFGPIVEPGTQAGRLLPEICGELNAPAFPVCAVAEHDTASAVAAVPFKEAENSAYLSCGTWSLFGIEAGAPIINAKSCRFNFTNEGGYGGKIRFLKNIIGLWLMQECRRQWEREGDALSFADIDRLTAAAKPLARFINPDYPAFAAPGDMPARIREYCIKTGQTPPESKGEVARCITESLALRFRAATEELEEIIGRRLECLHIIGGGVKDKLLCQCTANATGKTVFAGPVEATALGNLSVQLIAAGELRDIAQVREVIAASFPPEVYLPQDGALWDEAYLKYLNVIEKERQAL